jgi:hypothetical protein
LKPGGAMMRSLSRIPGTIFTSGRSSDRGARPGDSATIYDWLSLGEPLGAHTRDPI